ncbi:hypothetical protein L1987_11572 [Smallanthus sonchifolius]|uniref:Uncharacterized protein n=1 Tax=Smallanthus sonchifolius TaxID=185202 RepID=A0ACB9JC69_9ASTR|nr:hypothetical protein L1987_11572 [Smallanthus sonchifolius]
MFMFMFMFIRGSLETTILQLIFSMLWISMIFNCKCKYIWYRPGVAGTCCGSCPGACLGRVSLCCRGWLAAAYVFELPLDLEGSTRDLLAAGTTSLSHGSDCRDPLPAGTHLSVTALPRRVVGSDLDSRGLAQPEPSW